MGKKLLPIYNVELQDDGVTPHWYVMMVQYQDKYSRDLMKRVKNMDLEDLILETFIPTKVYEKIFIDNNGKQHKIKCKDPIWPTNYLLIHMVMNLRTWSICHNASYAMGWLNADGKPKAISDGEVMMLKETCGVMTGIKQQAIVEFKGKIGDQVRIINHVFIGKEGQISSFENNIMTVVLDNGFKITLEPYQVEVVNKEKKNKILTTSI